MTIREHHFPLLYRGVMQANMRLEEDLDTGLAFFQFTRELNETTQRQIRMTLPKRTLRGGRFHIFRSRKAIFDYLKMQGWREDEKSDAYYYIDFNRPLFDPANPKLIFE